MKQTATEKNGIKSIEQDEKIEEKQKQQNKCQNLNRFQFVLHENVNDKHYVCILDGFDDITSNDIYTI